MLRLLLLVVPIAALAACQTKNPNYCPDDAGMCGSPGDGSSGGHCDSDTDCKTADFPACELTIHQCKPCTASNAGVCTGTDAPRCEDNACVACVDDKDCSNGAGVCLATGGCALPGQIIHADSIKAGSSDCGDGILPACSLTGALGLVTPGKNVIKLDDAGPFVTNGVMVTNDVTIDARGATLNRADGGPIITVMGGKSLTLLGGTIQGAHGGMGSGILCNGATINADQTMITGNEHFGIDATNCTVTVTRAKIENNMDTGMKASSGSLTLVRTWLDTNNGGGVDVNTGAKFIIVGNVIVNNGTMTGSIGGIGIVTNASNNRLEFNSIAENKAQATAAAGIACTANANFVANNNIVWSNNSFVASMAGIQVSGACGHSYSDIGPAPVIGPINVASNQNVDPKFKDKTADLHLTSMSPLQMLQQLNPGTNLDDPKDPAAKDIDGQLRVPPVNIGADQQ